MKKLYVGFAFALVIAIATMAFTPFVKTGCLQPGSYIFAANATGVNYTKMDSGIAIRQRQYSLGEGFSADGKIWVDRCSFYFSKITPGNNSEIFRAAVNGSWINQMTNTPDVSEIDPYVSPDGSHILFTAWNTNSVPNLGIMNRNGSGYRIIASNAYAPIVNAKDEIPVWIVMNWGVLGYKYAENLRAATIRPEGNLVAIVTNQGDLYVVPIDPDTWLPIREPLRTTLGQNLFSAVWVNIP